MFCAYAPARIFRLAALLAAIPATRTRAAAPCAPGVAAAAGTVQGRVFKPVSREYVGDAEVRLGGTERIVFTESDGTFAFPGVGHGDVLRLPAATEAFNVVAGGDKGSGFNS
jgi:hypothetical protein